MARIGKDSLWSQPGSASYSVVLPQIHRTSLIVIAGGKAYLVDIEKRCWLALFGGAIDAAIAVPEASRFILANGVWLEAWDGQGLRWRSRRISWDGI